MRAVLEDGSVSIWKRAIKPDSGTLPAAEARALLRLRLARKDLLRADLLATKAREGDLSAREERELENYLTIGSTLEFLKSKARHSLRHTRTSR